jgi:hypothetical protein
MTAYLVERYLPGMSEAQASAAVRRAPAACAELTAAGRRVRYLGSILMPSDEACFCRFDADSEETVARVNELAGIPFARITEAHIVLP